MKLTDLIKKLKEEYKLKGDRDVQSVIVAPDGELVIGSESATRPPKRATHPTPPAKDSPEA